MKFDLQSEVIDPELWNVLKAKYEKSSAETDSCRLDAFCKRDHDDHPDDDALLEGEKSAKRQKTPRGTIYKGWQEDLITSKKDTLVLYGTQRNPNEPPRYLYNNDLFYLKNGNTKEKKYVLSLHKVHATSFPKDDLEEKLTRWVHREFKTFNKEARISIQHYRDTWHKRFYMIKQRKERADPEEVFSNHKIIEFFIIATDKPYGLDFLEEIIVKRDNNKPNRFSEADFKYLNKKDIEDLYYLCLNNKDNYRENKLLNSLHTFIRSSKICERVHDFQLGIEIYQMKVNLTAPTLTIPGIDELNPYSTIDIPFVGIVYLNNKEKRRIMGLTKIRKFCDATLDKVLKEVKFFESEYKMKTLVLDNLDLKIMKKFEREIKKRLKQRMQMRRWESFVNGRPILHCQVLEE
ncbi:hypothetical protein Tco_0529830 [Tanacetum coccineum]